MKHDSHATLVGTGSRVSGREGNRKSDMKSVFLYDSSKTNGCLAGSFAFTDPRPTQRPLFLHLSTSHDLDWRAHRPRLGALRFHGFQDVHTVYDLAEDDVFPI